MAINKAMKMALKALSDSEMDLKTSRFLTMLKELDPKKPFYKTVDDKILNGSHEVPVRIYFPETEVVVKCGKGGSTFPVLLFLHGGGWVTESVETYNSVCHYLAQNTGHVVVSVDYRLAPENRFPLGLEDCYAAAKAVFTNQFLLNVDPEQVTLIGDSAGGNLAAAVSLMARERGEFMPKRQILIYPCVNNDFTENSSYPSVIENGTDYLLTRKNVYDYLQLYKSKDEDFLNPYFSPLMEKDYTKQPKTLVITAEYDPLRDEGEEYARRLKRAGGDVFAYRMKDALHGYFLLSSFNNRFALIRDTYELINKFLDGGD